MNQYEFELQEKLLRLSTLLRYQSHKNHLEFAPMVDPSRGQGRVLAALKMQPEITTKDLAYLLGIRPQSLNELLAKLEKNGYITREPSEADRRVIVNRITEKGRNETQQTADLIDIFGVLNEEEQKRFGEALDRLIAALEEELGEVRDDDELAWLQAARERLGGNFDALLEMRGHFRRGGFPNGRGFPHGFEGITREDVERFRNGFHGKDSNGNESEGFM
jgi:DNA-binding MarR family transcriptional regulator